MALFLLGGAGVNKGRGLWLGFGGGVWGDWWGITSTQSSGELNRAQWAEEITSCKLLMLVKVLLGYTGCLGIF